MRSSCIVPVATSPCWSIANFSRGPWLSRSIDASMEALAVVAVKLGPRPASVGRILRPLPVRVALTLARPLTPFDLVAYLNFHFTKVGPQTRLMLQTYARHAEEAGLSKSALEVLRSAL